MTTERTKNAWRGVYDWLQTVICVVVVVVLLFTFVGRLSRVDGSSMRETLQDQDLLLVLNNDLCGSYEPGDIVIAQRPDFNGGAPIVKRVIATEGQTVDIDFAAGVVYVDGQVLEEPYTREPTWVEEGTEFPLTVPEGCVFLMGDNRNRSEDSRSSDLGPVDTRWLLGKAVFLALPGPTADLGEREWSRIGVLH